MPIVDISSGRPSRLLDQFDNPQLMSDTGRADALYKLHGGKLFYVPELNIWRAWKGGQWHTRSGNARAIAEAMLEKIVGTLEGRTAGGLSSFNWRTQIMTDSSIRRLVNVIRHREEFQRPSRMWDANPLALAAQNCVIELRSGQGREEVPEDFISKRCQAEFDFEADDSLWCQVIDGVCGAKGGTDHPYREYLQETFGLALYGSNITETISFLAGPGGTSKSTVLHAIAHALGQYSVALKPDTLSTHQSGAIREDVTACEGARFVYLPELPASSKLDIQFVKMISSRDTFRARGMRENSREIKSTWRPFAACNHLPKTQTEPDSGFWRRVVVLPFVNAPPEIDTHLGEKLESPEGAAGVLAWLVRGCKAALGRQQRGEEQLEPPAVVQDAIERYRALSYSNVQLFIESRLEDCPGAVSSFEDLYRAYVSWFAKLGMMEDGAKLVPKSPFGTALSARGWLVGSRATIKGKKHSTRRDVHIRERRVPLTTLFEQGVPLDFY